MIIMIQSHQNFTANLWFVDAKGVFEGSIQMMDAPSIVIRLASYELLQSARGIPRELIDELPQSARGIPRELIDELPQPN